MIQVNFCVISLVKKWPNFFSIPKILFIVVYSTFGNIIPIKMKITIYESFFSFFLQTSAKSGTSRKGYSFIEQGSLQIFSKESSWPSPTSQQCQSHQQNPRRWIKQFIQDHQDIFP